MSDLTALLAKARYLLLDFDGPVCAVYAGSSAAHVAQTLREQLAGEGIRLPDDGQPSDDPLDVFRGTRDISRQASAAVQRVLTGLEVEAVASARPTPGAAELLKEAHQTGRTIAIVSNNSGAAIRAYLQQHGLTQHVGLIVGRDSPYPDLMKPSPYLVRAAVGILDTEGQHSVFIGDSASDILAGLLAGVPVIGYASTPAKARDLADAGSAALATSMDEIRTAIRDLPPADVAELRRTLDQGGAAARHRGGASRATLSLGGRSRGRAAWSADCPGWPGSPVM
jgi:phosphoglycolate phosphatase